jgi:hypothetical protein
MIQFTDIKENMKIKILRQKEVKYNEAINAAG